MDAPTDDTQPRHAWTTGLAALALALAFCHTPPWPVAECAVAGLALVLLVQAVRRGALPSGAPLWAWLASALIVLSLARAPGLVALQEIGQLVGVLIVGVIAFRAVPLSAAPTLRSALAFGWLVCLGWAWIDYLSGAPGGAVGGALGHRALFGTLLAAATPLVLVWIAARRPARAGWLVALAVLAAAVVTLYLPALILLALAVVATAIGCLPSPARATALAALCLAFLLIFGGLLPRANQRDLASSVARSDAAGTTRRWVLELQAGLAAVADRPLRGHGPGRFQAVVSSGTYRAFLPTTAEHVVEPGTQCGYLVLAVEYGVLPAMLLVVLLLAAARRALQQAQEETMARALALSLLLLILGGAVTHLLVQGAGVLVAALIGMAYAGPAAAAVPQARLQQLGLQATSLALLLGVAAWLGRGASRTDTGAPAPPAAQAVIVVEAEAAQALPPLMRRREAEQASMRVAVAVDESKANLLQSAASATYPITVTEGGVYRLWLRARWRDGCSNSVAAGFGAAALALVGNDGTYGVWHWVKGPTFRLPAGDHMLRVAPREPAAWVDQMVLAQDPDFYPIGILMADGRTLAPSLPSSPAAQIPAWRPEERPAQDVFQVGIGGAYCVGPEAFLVNLGIPYVRLRQNEMWDLEALKACQVVWIAGPQVRTSDVWKTMEAYVRQGGTLIFEVPQEGRGRQMAEQQALLAPYTGFESRGAARGLTVRAAGSALFAGVRDGLPIQRTVTYWPLMGSGAGGTWATHGEVQRYGRSLGPAVLKKRLGRGTFYLLPLPLGFIALRDQRELDPVSHRLLLEAVGSGYVPLYADLSWDPQPASRIHFADDFMRRSGEGRSWQRETGKFYLTGERPNDPLAFSLKAAADASAVSGNPGWRDYRVSASVLVTQGAGGVWLTTSRKRRLLLLLDGSTRTLRLLEHQDTEERQLARAEVPPPHQGWRRISLFACNDMWQGWIDGQPRIKMPAAGETASGVFGLAAPEGTCYFDDVHVSDVAALLPGTDLALGDEGSPRAETPFTKGLEPRTIFSPLWYLRPDPKGRHAVRLGLPTYHPAQLSMDGKLLGTVPPDSAGALILLPAGARPRTALEVVCPDWLDYTFGSRLTDWYSTGTAWQQHPRWACDPRWFFLGVRTHEPSILWHRRTLRPPFCVSVLAAPSADRFPRTFEIPRDLNLVLGGNGRNLTGAYTVHVGAADQSGCELRHAGKPLGRNPGFGLPQSQRGRYALHHRWFAIKAMVDNQRIRLFYEGALALDVHLPTPVPPGQIGFWTQDNSVHLARATLAVSAH